MLVQSHNCFILHLVIFTNVGNISEEERPQINTMCDNIQHFKASKTLRQGFLSRV